MPDEKAPSPEKILETLPLERQPYILANLALCSGDMDEMVDALAALEVAHADGTLRPPLPSVHYATIKETVNAVRFTRAINAKNVIDERGVQVLLATVIDFGNVRYATDPSHNEKTGRNQATKVRPNPPVIPRPAMKPGRRRG